MQAEQKNRKLNKSILLFRTLFSKCHHHHTRWNIKTSLIGSKRVRGHSGQRSRRVSRGSRGWMTGRLSFFFFFFKPLTYLWGIHTWDGCHLVPVCSACLQGDKLFRVTHKQRHRHACTHAHAAVQQTWSYRDMTHVSGQTFTNCMNASLWEESSKSVVGS